MSNSFAGVATFPFRGTTFRLPVKLPQGVQVPANQVPPSVCPVTIDWNIYWQLAGQPANVGVNLNLQASSVQQSILDRIASVKIDNTGSPSPVYVQFLDTGDVINCPANASVTFPCLTGLLQAVIIALNLTPGFIPTTRVFFYNIVLPPSVDYEVSQSVDLQKASPSITRGNTILNANFDAPALGDQFFISDLIDLTIHNNFTAIWKTPSLVAKFLYVKDASLIITGSCASGNIATGDVSILSTGAAGLLALSEVSVGPPEGGNSTYQIDLIRNGNVKLDATQGWIIQCFGTMTSGSAVARMCSTFTLSNF